MKVLRISVKLILLFSTISTQAMLCPRAPMQSQLPAPRRQMASTANPLNNRTAASLSKRPEISPKSLAKIAGTALAASGLAYTGLKYGLQGDFLLNYSGTSMAFFFSSLLAHAHNEEVRAQEAYDKMVKLDEEIDAKWKEFGIVPQGTIFLTNPAKVIDVRASVLPDYRHCKLPLLAATYHLTRMHDKLETACKALQITKNTLPNKESLNTMHAALAAKMEHQFNGVTNALEALKKVCALEPQMEVLRKDPLIQHALNKSHSSKSLDA